MDLIKVQVMDKAVCISLPSNALGKGMNPSIPPPFMCKIVGQIVLFSMGRAASLEEGKTLNLNQLYFA